MFQIFNGQAHRMPKACKPSALGVAAALIAITQNQQAPLLCAEAEYPTSEEKAADKAPRVIKTTMFNGWNATLTSGKASTVNCQRSSGPWGKDKGAHSTHLLKPTNEVERMLKSQEKRVTFNRTGNPLQKFNISILPGNTPCEDGHAVDVIPAQELARLAEQSEGQFWMEWYEARKSARGDHPTMQSRAADGHRDLVFASVFDGHGGHEQSEICSKTVHACIARAIGMLRKDNMKLTQAEMKEAIVQTIKEVDEDLLKMPEQVALSQLRGPENIFLPNPPPSLYSIRHLEGPGCTLLTAVLDIENDDLYVANLGDARCVVGWYNPQEAKWRCDTLSRDMTPDDPDEEAIIRNEHLNDNQRDLVVDRGFGRRVLGRIQTSKAMGDQNVKRDMELTKVVHKALQQQNEDYSSYLGEFVSPPYITNNAEIQHRKLHPESGEELKFIILGVDGLFDRITSEEATLIMSAYLAHPKHQPIPKSQLPGLFPQFEPPAERPWPQQPLPGSEGRNVGHWVFENDSNAATHLIRNCLLGNGHPEARHQVLSLDGSAARSMRDDTTAVVMLFDEKVVYTSKQNPAESGLLPSNNAAQGTSTRPEHMKSTEMLRTPTIPVDEFVSHGDLPKIFETTTFQNWPATLSTGEAETVTYTSNQGPWGKTDPFSSTHILKSHGETAKKLTQNQSMISYNRPGNPLWKYDLNYLPGNNQGEDGHAVDVIPADQLARLTEDHENPFWLEWYEARKVVRGDHPLVQSKAGDGHRDLIFASVFDGHGGKEMSEICSKTVHACLARAIGMLHKEKKEVNNKVMMNVIRQTLLAIDDDFKTMPELIATSQFCGPENSALPNPAPALYSVRNINGPGCTLTTAIIDIEHDDLYVANIGDSRCVAGWFDPATGKWRCDILTRDMTPDDPEEEALIRSQHPNDDQDNLVIDRGYGRRVLGIIQPSRAMGDQWEKRPKALEKSLEKVFQTSHPDLWWMGEYVSPPYMQNEPEIQHRKLHPENGEVLKFIILGVDGLFDRLTSEEATLIMAAYLTHPEHAPIPKTDLPGMFPFYDPPAERLWPQQPLPGTEDRIEGHWVFEGDQNAATHLIKNCLVGDGDLEMRRQVLSLDGKAARDMRDDTTAIVLHFDGTVAYTSKQKAAEAK